NPGSVGQPRDRCPLCSFGIFDTDNWTMTFFRLQYDVAGAQQAITAAGLPEKFARRLELGV
ncbi:MAG: metallophosphoesterase family protein, partial [Planctomycetota bacterium]